MAGTVTTLACWYQEEPHAEQPPLPTPEARHVAAGWLQIGLCGLAAMGVVALGAALVL